MMSIVEEQDAIGGTNFAEGKVTKRIRDIQMMYICNRNVTYTVGHCHWMRDFVRKLMGLTHECWLGRNFMKHNKTKGMITINTNEELLREADRVAQQSSLNIE